MVDPPEGRNYELKDKSEETTRSSAQQDKEMQNIKEQTKNMEDS